MKKTIKKMIDHEKAEIKTAKKSMMKDKKELKTIKKMSKTCK